MKNQDNQITPLNATQRAVVREKLEQVAKELALPMTDQEWRNWKNKQIPHKFRHNILITASRMAIELTATDLEAYGLHGGTENND